LKLHFVWKVEPDGLLVLCLDLLGDWNVDDENRGSCREERPLYTFVLRVLMNNIAYSTLPADSTHNFPFYPVLGVFREGQYWG
jgi:hypothetical protein